MLPLLFAGIAALTFINSSQAGPLRYRQQNSIQWVDCASNVPQPLQGQSLPTTLPSTLHCGRLDVPMDYAKPIAADNKITLGFSMYRPDNPRDLINL
jgi:CHASE1-domain containing sensor protein